SALFKEGGYEHLSVFNCYRYLTRSPEESLEIILEIETASRLPVTGLVNASNLGFETGEETILDSLPYAGELAAPSARGRAPRTPGCSAPAGRSGRPAPR
ncbi:hypothetical protein NE646_14685, partial [Bittarella massiliensis]|nr:hypothetical protein [Bittarella massiliensis (ex Durand et al. 2017)]